MCGYAWNENSSVSIISMNPRSKRAEIQVLLTISPARETDAVELAYDAYVRTYCELSLQSIRSTGWQLSLRWFAESGNHPIIVIPNDQSDLLVSSP